MKRCERAYFEAFKAAIEQFGVVVTWETRPRGHGVIRCAWGGAERVRPVSSSPKDRSDQSAANLARQDARRMARLLGAAA